LSIIVLKSLLEGQLIRIRSVILLSDIKTDLVQSIYAL
jgi:hypothetical protein